MNDVIWLTVRRLRTPLILLISVYFISSSLLVAVPGMDEAGNPVHMSYLEAAYFIAFLSTTIGLGEIPYPFTGAQRFLVFFLIFPNVVAWLYSIGVILGLFLDEQFRATLNRNVFRRRVSRFTEPFFLMCGFGNTGSELARGLMKRGFQLTVIEQDPGLVHRRHTEVDFSHLALLAGDTTEQSVLADAGLHRENCIGVIAVTNDNHANLTIAITTKLLRPGVPVYARSQDGRVSDNMRSFGTDAVVDPYVIFAQRLDLALNSPTKYLVQDWLISVPGTKLREPLTPPSGHWVVCGGGRFGKRLIQTLEKNDQEYTLVDVRNDRVDDCEHGVVGRGTEAPTLLAAGIEEAAGIIAGTGDDVDNLSIIITARESTRNKKLFVIGRQEQRQNDELFEASGAHLVARPNWIVARSILASATTPGLSKFLNYLIHADEDFARRVEHKLSRCLGGVAPVVWSTELSGAYARGLSAAREEGIDVRLESFLHNTRSGQNEDLRCVCLMLKRGAQELMLPSLELSVIEGDILLFAGRSSAQREVAHALTDPILLLDYATPRRIPRTAIGRLVDRRLRGKKVKPETAKQPQAPEQEPGSEP